MPTRRSILLLLGAGVLCTSAALAQDNETMRKQFRQLGVPEAEIDRMLKGLDDKLKESGASEAERGAIMSQRKRGVKVHARWSMEVKRHEDEIVYACNKQPPHPPRFSCQYRLGGRATIPADVHYLPLPQTERIMRSSKEDQERATAVLGIRPKIAASMLPAYAPVTVEGECTAPGQTIYSCNVRSVSSLYAKNKVKGDILGTVAPGAKGVRIAFNGSLFDGQISGKAIAKTRHSLDELKNDPKLLLKKGEVVDAAVAIAPLRLPVNSDVANEDYLIFFKQLFQTGHFRKTYRWPEIGYMGGETGDGQVELEIDVELEGGPAPNELKPAKR
jgi:hypothetical protein